jgi:hypothetical protein
MGAASTILLTNKDNILPLSSSQIRKLAIIGSDAGPSKGYATRTHSREYHIQLISFTLDN